MVAQGLRTVTELMAWSFTRTLAKNACDKTEILVAIVLEAYTYKHQSDIESRLAFVWQMHNAPATLAAARSTALEDVVAAASSATCPCAGTWAAITEELLHMHCQFPGHIPQEEMPLSTPLRAAIAASLQQWDWKNKQHSHLPKPSTQ